MSGRHRVQVTNGRSQDDQAWCAGCNDFGGTGVTTAQARRHVEQTGHTVYINRSSTARVAPIREAKS